MDAKPIAYAENGDLTSVMVDGRSFVHGSVLDSECSARNAEIKRLNEIVGKAFANLDVALAAPADEYAALRSTLERIRDLGGRRPQMEMTLDFQTRLAAAADLVKAKGWPSCRISFEASLLAMMDTGSRYMAFSASIRSNTSHNYVAGFSFDSAEEALAAIEKTAREMPEFKTEEKIKAEALAKLSPDERRLLGVPPQ